MIPLRLTFINLLIEHYKNVHNFTRFDSYTCGQNDCIRKLSDKKSFVQHVETCVAKKSQKVKPVENDDVSITIYVTDCTKTLKSKGIVSPDISMEPPEKSARSNIVGAINDFEKKCKFQLKIHDFQKQKII